VSVPYWAVMSAGEHVLPERELHISYDLPNGWMLRTQDLDLFAWIKVFFWAGKADLKTLRPRPEGAISRLDGFGDRVPDAHLADMKRGQQGRRQVQVPLVEIQGRNPCHRSSP